jgi:hypothetical protein
LASFPRFDLERLRGGCQEWEIIIIIQNCFSNEFSKDQSHLVNLLRFKNPQRLFEIGDFAEYCWKTSNHHNSQSKTVHDIAAARVRDARSSPVKEVQISLEDLQ